MCIYIYKHGIVTQLEDSRSPGPTSSSQLGLVNVPFQVAAGDKISPISGAKKGNGTVLTVEGCVYD